MTPRRHLTAAALTCLLALTACTTPADGTTDAAGSGPRRLTAEEADRLALARFATYRRGTGNITVTIPTRGRTLHLSGRIDWRRHTGYATLRTDDHPPTTQLVRWNLTRLRTHPATTGPLPEHPPADGWQERPLERLSSTLDTVLLLLLNLSADRPDNAQLLTNSTARRLGEERIGTTPVMVVSGPAPAGRAPNSPGNTRYWIDATGNLLRFTARPGGETAWTTADLPQTPAPPLPPDPTPSP
ncbi:hypothetical protein ACQKM2_02005 [Streptomyces sp. NPDC004126]|uniref:hypothetical protein n=1 Tax=Streptomyces sp. NPDC004126 TaxID=3390695 RepID=UPI003CFC49A9